MGNTGVMLPCTMACTAIGMKGVVVTALVAVNSGEGVMTKKVGVSCWGAAVALATGAVDVADAGMGVAVRLGAGAWRGAVGRLRKNRDAATATDRRPPTSDQRARATYFRFAR